MSSDNDTVYFSETDSEYSLYINNGPFLLNTSYSDCLEQLEDVKDAYQRRDTDRKFILDRQGDKFTLVSFPKNYPTSYEQVELKAEIFRED